MEIGRGLEPMQKLVGGYIESVPLSRNVNIFCNEEGRLQGLPRNRWVASAQDYLCGTFFVSRHNEDGETVDLTPGDVMHYAKEFSLRHA